MRKENEQAARSSFHTRTEEENLDLSPTSVETLQVNINRVCNQACKHCHIGASPRREEQMDLETVNQCLKVLRENPEITTVDLTGGAPELNPHFRLFVREAVKMKKHVIVRHNLTVTLDPHPKTGESMEYLPEFFAETGVEVASSLPYYQPFFTDSQRGKGVFEKSINSLKMLNKAGYGREDTGLVLNLVYNPAGAFLPANQEDLERDFKKELKSKYDIDFNGLYTITNIPINRFKAQLTSKGILHDYMTRLKDAFNPEAAKGVMCRSMVSVGYDGRLYDCDFNQAEGIPIKCEGHNTIFTFDYEKIRNREIVFADYCFGCTAGAGSSCGGATA